EVHTRLPHFDAVARTKLFSQDEDAVDERAVAALEVDDLVDSVAADDLAMSARAIDVVDLDRVLVRSSDRCRASGELDGALFPPALVDDELRVGSLRLRAPL